MEYRILGSIEVLDPSGRKLALGGAMQQSVLASLLLRAGQTVVLDRLVEELWDDPPASAARTVQAYVSRLRHELPKRAIESRPGGYVLRLDGDELDLDTFARGAEEGHAALAAGDHEQAARLLREALALWRGPALAGLTSEALRRHAEQLEEQRLSALEDRLEADLESARHSEIVPELTALVAEHPFRERLRAQLMKAFYRSGRPGEALALYRETRRLLVEELGMEPGQELRELEQAILRQDPELAEAPSPEPRTAATEIVPVPLLEREPLGSQGPTPTAASRYPRRRTIAYGALAGVIAAAVAIPLFALGGSGVDHADLGETPGNSVGVLDANSGDARAPVALPAPPTAVAAGRGLVWAASADSNAVYAIDPKTNTKLQTIPVGNAPGGIAVGGGYVWVTNSLAGTVSQIDPRAQIELQQIHVGNGPTGIAVGGGHVWVANTTDHTVSKISASDGELLETYAAGDDPGAVAVGAGAVWVASKSNDTVVKLNPHDGQPLRTIGVGHSPAAVTVGLGSVWVANSGDGTVMQIDPVAEKVVGTEKVGAGPSGIAIVQGEVWTANELDGTISRIDSAKRLPRTVHVGGRPSAVAPGDGTAYVALRPTGMAHRGGTLRVALFSFEPLTTVDLAVGSNSSLSRFAALTNDGLLAYQHVAGQAGYQLVPDLARLKPDISLDRKTYTFRLRPNIHYSNGRLVKASDFRYAIERVFKLREHPAIYPPDTFRGIRGAERCHWRRCNLASGIETDDRARTIRFHLSAPDPNFLHQLAASYAAAVPAGWASREAKREPLPATGPYRIVSFTDHSVRLVRNPYFRQWSEAAQPRGFPDEVVIERVPTPGRGIALVENDKADLASSQPLSPFSVPPTSSPRKHEHPLAGFAYLVLDAGRPPFDDLRARRALNYALDRKKVMQLTTEKGLQGRAWCQVLPPNFPGHRPYCPYTLDASPGGAGAWTAPDPAQAARLVAASGTAGASVSLWVDRDFARARGRVGLYLKRLLKQLRYRPQLRASFKGTPENYFTQLVQGVMSRRGGPQIAYAGWGADYPAASDFIQSLFACRSETNYSRYCDRALDRRIKRAVQLEQTDRAGANRLWAKLDREITDKALVVPLINGTGADLVSKRVGNYQYNPQYGPLLSQLWVR